jgi:hypothetical protein
MTMPASGADQLLVCVYYRVGRGQVDAAIARVRDIQRTLAAGFEGLQAQVLVRCELRADPSSAAPRAPGASPARAAAADDTLMETYRLPLPADAARASRGGAIDAPEAERLLQALDAAASSLAPLLAGARHVEVFLPCAS